MKYMPKWKVVRTIRLSNWQSMKKMHFSRLALELGLEVQSTMSAVPPKRKYFYAHALYDHDFLKHS